MTNFRLGRHHDLRRTTNPRCGIACPRRHSFIRRLRTWLPRWDRTGLM